MKKYTVLLLILAISKFGSAQLSDHNTNDSWFIGASLNVVTLKNGAGLNDKASKIGPYIGIGGQIYHDSYEPFGFRYHLDMKWVPDLGFKAVELFREVGTDLRLDFTGFTSHKVGLNLISTDVVCFGLGGSFSDYIVDIPHTDESGTVTTIYNWKEPSGWHWTAGPTIFLDGGFGGFTLNLISSYELSYFQPIVTNDYEALTEKIENYEKPAFLKFDLTINHESGVYFSYDKTVMIDRGVNANKVSRGDFQIGYKFWI